MAEKAVSLWAGKKERVISGGSARVQGFNKRVPVQPNRFVCHILSFLVGQWSSCNGSGSEGRRPYK